MSNPPLIAIRPATVADVPQILALIRELAEFERLAHAAIATESNLRAQLFGDHPAAEVLMAEADDAIAGFTVFFHNFSTFSGKRGLYLEDVYVRPAFRGLGIGKHLMGELARIALARGCGHFEWSVLDWNQPAIDFYRSLGAVSMPDWVKQRLSGEALHALAAHDAL